MRHIEDITEDEMIAEFLRAEIRSESCARDILDRMGMHGVARRVLDHPNTDSAWEDAYRMELLGWWRGYPDKMLFRGFPRDVAWQRVALSQNELWRVNCIGTSDWHQLSSGSRLPRDVARGIHAGRTVCSVPNASILAMKGALRAGKVFPQMILVRANEGGPLVALEGNKRLTAYALAPEATPAELPLILGTSPGMVRWGFWGPQSLGMATSS